MLAWRILCKGDGKEEILATLNLTVFFAYLLESDVKDGNQSVPQWYNFKSNTEICFKQVTSV